MPTASIYCITPRSHISPTHCAYIGPLAPSTVFFPRCRAQCAAPPTISQKINQCGSSVVFHSSGIRGLFQSSTHSKNSPNRLIKTSRKSAYCFGLRGGEHSLGAIPRHGGV